MDKNENIIKLKVNKKLQHISECMQKVVKLGYQ